MKVAILYREGHSGSFLYAVLTNRSAKRAKFRMLDHYEMTDQPIFLTHNIDRIDKTQFDCILRILPSKNIYNAIYNIFMKKTLLEEFPQFKLEAWTQDVVFWYDKCYYLIKHYYNQIVNDIATNTVDNIVDFDQLCSCDYISNLLIKYFNTQINDNQKTLIKNYANLQLQIALRDDNLVTMQDIVSPLTDQMMLENPWYWAYAVFKYEHNNKITEAQRIWSVNDFDKPQTLSDLKNYRYSKNCFA